jgi:hypothetical protein
MQKLTHTAILIQTNLTNLLVTIDLISNLLIGIFILVIIDNVQEFFERIEIDSNIPKTQTTVSSLLISQRSSINIQNINT